MAPSSHNAGTTPNQSHHRQRHSSYYQPSTTPAASPQPRRVAKSSAHPRAGSRPPRPVPRQPAFQEDGRYASYSQPGVPLAPTMVAHPTPVTYPVRSQGLGPKGYVLAGSSVMLAAMAFLLPHSFKDKAAPKSDLCQQQVQASSFLSRDELTKLLSVPERSKKEAVRQVIAEPYCLMSATEVREGVQAEREAYPLEFDPQTWVVVLYEGDEYAGYDFSFRH